MERKLTELCYIQYGYAFDSAKFTEDSNYPPLVRIRDVQRGYSETYYSGDYSKEYVLHFGDLLIGMDGEFNIARWKSRDALLNQRVCKITAKKDTSEEYLRFALSKSLKEIEDRTAFVTVKHLSAKELNKLVIDIPPYAEQITIANALGRIEHIIFARQQELQKLDELVKARFVEMFGSVENNVLGLETIKIKNACDLINGKAFKPEDWSDEGLPIVRIQNLNNEQAPFNYYAGEIKAQYLIDTGELLFSWSGTPGTSFGAFFWNRGKAVLNQHIFRVKPKIEVNLSFLQFALNGRIDYIISKAHGGVGLQHITKKELDEVELLLPAIDLQNQFAVFVEQIDKSKFVKKIEQSEVLL